MNNHDIAKKADRPVTVFGYWYREFYAIENWLIWKVQWLNGKKSHSCINISVHYGQNNFFKVSTVLYNCKQYITV